MGVHPKFKFRKLLQVLPQVTPTPTKNMFFPCQVFSPMSMSQIIFMKGYHLICFVFNHLLRCPWHENGAASALTFQQFSKYPHNRKVNVAKCFLRSHFLQLGRIQWHLLWLFSILLKMEDIFIPPFTSNSLFFAVCEQETFVICLIWVFFKFYRLPVRYITNTSTIEATFAGTFVL